jgi:hypothetical protein
MIYSQVFHQILCFLSDFFSFEYISNFPKKRDLGGEGGRENFKISENNIINVELAQVNNKVINNQRRCVSEFPII